MNKVRCEMNGQIAFKDTNLHCGNVKRQDFLQVWYNATELSKLRKENLCGLEYYKSLYEKCRGKYVAYRTDNDNLSPHSAIE